MTIVSALAPVVNVAALAYIIYCSFVVSFGYGKYHRIAAAARVKLCRADQVAHVFQYRKVKLVKKEALQTFF